MSCGCGLNSFEMTSSRIFGGEVPANGATWSMMASLRFNGTGHHGCGGTILTDSFFLMAAHCVNKLSATSPLGLTVRAAMDDLSESAQESHEVDQIFVPPKCVGAADGYQNDIALLHVKESIDIDGSPFTTRTCVPQLSATTNVLQYPLNGTRLAVVGGGIVESGAVNTSTMLQQADVFAIDNNDPKCQSVTKDKQTQFCTGLPNGGKGLHLLHDALISTCAFPLC
jgi:secreted trypsin-like serine protease